MLERMLARLLSDDTIRKESQVRMQRIEARSEDVERTVQRSRESVDRLRAELRLRDLPEGG